MRSHSGIIAATGNSSEAQQFFNRLITTPTPERQTVYAQLINSLLNAGVWPLLDALYLFAAADTATALVNLKQQRFSAGYWEPITTTYPAFIPDQGWLTSDIDVNISTNFNPSTSGGNFTQNSACVGSWSLTSAQTDAMLIGTRTQAVDIEIFPKRNDNSTCWGLNDAAEQTSTGATDASGWWFMQRTASNAQAIYRNDTLIDSKSNASSSPVNEVIHFTGPYRHAAGVIGAALSNTHRSALYLGIHTYLHAIAAI
jgi:hypothetical protein